MPRRTATAFTLVELLVVVAIIALLLAMMMPALESAKVAGFRAKCLANEHGIGHGMSLWLQDHKQRYPEYTVVAWCGLLGSLGDAAYNPGNYPTTATPSTATSGCSTHTWGSRARARS
jgi:prepilin-type N-terminal cleavage/methylation domain-containing protein